MLGLLFKKNVTKMTTTSSIGGKMPKGNGCWDKEKHGKDFTENQHKKKKSTYNHRGYPFAKNKRWNKKKGEYTERKEPGGIYLSMDVTDLKKGAILYPKLKGFHQGLWKVTKETKRTVCVIPVKEFDESINRD